VTTIVLLSGRVDPSRSYLARAAGELAEYGKVTGVITYGPIGRWNEPEIPVIVIDRKAKIGPAYVGWRKHARRVKRILTGGTNDMRFRAGLLASPEAMNLIDPADLVVAMENNAIEAAWHLQRRRHGLRAANGPIAARWIATEISRSATG
jgi:hypothetical protein